MYIYMYVDKSLHWHRWARTTDVGQDRGPDRLAAEEAVCQMPARHHLRIEIWSAQECLRAAQRNGNNLICLKDVCLRAKARIWP